MDKEKIKMLKIAIVVLIFLVIFVTIRGMSNNGKDEQINISIANRSSRN